VLELLYLVGGRNSVLGEMTKVLLDVGNFFLAVRHETFGGVFFRCLFFTASLLLREGNLLAGEFVWFVGGRTER
jgi:hypothetical protein